MKFFSNASKYKQTFSALVIYIFWVLSFAFYSFISEEKALYKAIDQQLVEAAQIIPLLLSENLHHARVTKADLTQEADIANRLKLSAYTDKNNIVYIYTLILQNNKIFFTSSSATVEERSTQEGLTAFFDHYDDVDPRVYAVFKNKQQTFIEYSDQWGTFRSVFMPLSAKDGSYYIAAADIAIDHIQAQLREHLHRTLVIALLFLVFAYPIYFTATKKIKRLAAGLAQTVQEQTTELASKTERLQLAMLASKQGWFDLDILSGTVIVSDEYPRLIGYDPSTFNSSLQEWQNNIHPDERHAVMRAFQESLVSKEPREMEYRRRHKEGGWVWIHTIGQVVAWDEQNRPCRMVGIHTDITERKRSEQILRTLAESGSAIDGDVMQHIVSELATSHNVRYAFIACFDDNSTDRVTTLVLWANNQFVANFSYDMEDTPCQLITQQKVVFYPDNIQQLFPKDLMLVDMSAVSYLGVPLKNSHNEVLGLLAMIDDKPMAENMYQLELLGSLAVRLVIELERRQAETQLKLSSQVFKAAHEGIVITDVSGVVVDVNPAFCDITGYSREEVIGEKPSILSSGKHDHEFFVEMWDTLISQGFWRGELWNRKKNGELYAELLTISATVNNMGKTQNYIGMFSDITRSKAQQKTLEMMAHYDVLTGLPNRSLFADRYQQAIAHSKRTKTLLAVCFLDLDEFKPVNDNYGHLVGDQLLIKVAERIKTQLRAEDTVARMGGDEFTLLLGDISTQEQCEQMLARLHRSLAHSFVVEGQEMLISASSGITLYPRDDADLDTLLRHADQAMYKAKLAGRNQYKFFDFAEDQQLVDKQQRLQEVQRALLQGEMHLYYQPKVNMRTGEVFGVEALIRWLHPQKGLIPPLDFLPILEGTEIENQLDEWVITTALQQLDTWQSLGLNLEVSVNISAYHLQSLSFIKVLTTALERHPEVDSNYFQLEILESSALGDLSAIRNIVAACRHQLGLHIALDDFGTGYSSLTHLRNLSANVLKIDQSFVKNVLDNANDFAIIEGVIGLASAFNRDIIAEGVETLEHGLILLAMGCEQAQGYGIAKPMPANEILAWIKDYIPKQKWIHYDVLPKTPIAKKIILFQLCLERWYNLFAHNIKSAPDGAKNWPVMTQSKCHHAIRFKQIRQEPLINQEWLRKINKDYELFQRTANDLFNQYMRGDIAGAIGGLDELSKIYQLMIVRLENELA
ncbi:MAG: EAL domain-containing protein [Methyloprofundus sp.]|nr:EAL domain-containing protein [Methyloprofundus sp.]